MIAAPHRSHHASRLARAAAWCLLTVLATALAACAASSSLDQTPTGPRAVTVLLRLRGPDGPQVELLATDVDQPTLDQAATAVATAVFPSSQPGAPVAPGSTMVGATASAVPITLSDAEQTFTVTNQQIDSALATIKPKNFAVWACTDGRRTIQVTTQAPGAISSDVISGSCRIVGSSVANDGVTWTSTVAVGPLEPPSLLPVMIWTSVILVLVTLAIAFWRGRAASRETRAEEPSEPPEASVH